MNVFVHTVSSRVDAGRRAFHLAIRSLRRSPTFTTAVTLSLALGVGANAAMFSVIDAVLLRPLPYPRSEELVTVGLCSRDGVAWQVSPRYMDAWRVGGRLMNDMAAISPYSAPVRAHSSSEYREGAQATSNLLHVLQIGPALGRWFSPEEERSSAHVVVLSHELWQTLYAGDSGAIGRGLMIYDQPWTIIGVMPSGSGRPFRADFWMPAEGNGGILIARVRAGVSTISSESELTGLVPPWEGNPRSNNRPERVVLSSLHDQLYGSARPQLRLLFGAVCLLFLLTCANIANLSLARVIERRHAIAVRATLGASRWSLLSDIVAENVLLAIGGGAAGVLIAFWTTRAFVHLSPEEITRVGRIDVTPSVVLYVGGLVALATLLVSAGPALAVAKGDLSAVVGQGGARSGHGQIARQLRRILVVGQISIALVLTIGAGLFVRSLARLSAVNVGFNPRGVVIATINLMEGGRVVDQTRITEISDRIRAFPGVQSVAFGPPPLVAGRGKQLREGFDILWFERFAEQSAVDSVARTIWVKFVNAGYLETFRIPLRAGRGILSSDDAQAPAVALINTAAAKLFFHDSNVVGSLFPRVNKSLSGGRPVTVVGEFEDVHQRDVALSAEPEILVPATQQQLRALSASISVRTVAAPDALLASIRTMIRAVDPDLTIMRMATMQSVVDDSLAPQRFLLFLFTAFAGLAVALASLGLYAVVAYVVAQRTHEIGVRIALGAQHHHVLRLVLREGLALVALGSALGVSAALALSRALATFLFEVRPHDVATFLAVPALLAVVALLATFIPAHRASRIDPMIMLRPE